MRDMNCVLPLQFVPKIAHRGVLDVIWVFVRVCGFRGRECGGRLVGFFKMARARRLMVRRGVMCAHVTTPNGGTQSPFVPILLLFLLFWRQKRCDVCACHDTEWTHSCPFSLLLLLLLKQTAHLWWGDQQPWLRAKAAPSPRPVMAAPQHGPPWLGFRV